MINAVLAYPVNPKGKIPVQFNPGYPGDWQKDGNALLKQIGFLGNAKYRSARVFRHTNLSSLLPLSRGFAVKRALIWRQNTEYAVLVICVQAPQSGILDNLSRPGLKSTSDWIHETFALQLECDSLIRATCISDYGSEVVGQDGQLAGVSSSNSFAFELQACQLAAVVATERILIHRATEATARPGFLFLRARKHHSLLSNWLTIPSSDSTRLIRETALLRDSLALDARRLAVLSSLESFNRASNLSVATTLGAFSFISTLTLSMLQPGTLFDASSLVGLSLCVSLLLGSVAWVASKP